ncbi:hypothetical protein [Actinokineospora pegani]|uniref:hypothetical protein n=1 Tax=Actinokineospora pegani TaxID=2654637 RepID=UPI0012EA0345|nr:hypothetical protein [Actinokineospora pegani]
MGLLIILVSLGVAFVPVTNPAARVVVMSAHLAVTAGLVGWLVFSGVWGPDLILAMTFLPGALVASMRLGSTVSRRARGLPV